MPKRFPTVLLLLGLLIGFAAAQEPKTRAESIPKDAVKATPADDPTPPILHSGEWEKPVPMEAPISTAGAEDSPFILPDGNTLYFFFTPDVRVPAEKQLFDGVTGVWVSRKVEGKWVEPERVILQDKGQLSLDGCVCVQGDTMWFGSARQGNSRGVDLWTAEWKEGNWAGWKNAGKTLNVDYEAGEMHLSADGKEMWFHSERAGGKGGLDIWVTRLVGGKWSAPENVAAVNSADAEGWPFVSQDGSELWFLRWYRGTPAIFRSKKSGGGWAQPELIVEQFAGEPTLDTKGNLIFVHHYFRDGKMIEADLYIARRK